MLKKEKYDGFFGGLYRRNEKFLILSTAIFLIPVFLGFALASVLSPILGVMFGEFKRLLNSPNITPSIGLKTFAKAKPKKTEINNIAVESISKIFHSVCKALQKIHHISLFSAFIYHS